MDQLEQALAGNPVTDWSQSMGEWAELRDRYVEALAEN
jgi:hypothetical protein